MRNAIKLKFLKERLNGMNRSDLSSLIIKNKISKEIQLLELQLKSNA